jgi:hypothetical protein
MSVIPAQDTWMILEDALYEIIRMETAEVNPTGRLAVQPNQDGSTGILLVDKITPPERPIFPNIGVQCVRYDEDPRATVTHDIVGTFMITISVRATIDDTTPDTGRAALQLLRNYQNDSSGNGLSPLLRSNVTLLNMCQWTQIKSMERFVNKANGDESSDAIAMAVYTFETHDQVRTE